MSVLILERESNEEEDNLSVVGNQKMENELVTTKSANGMNSESVI